MEWQNMDYSQSQWSQEYYSQQQQYQYEKQMYYEQDFQQTFQQNSVQFQPDNVFQQGPQQNFQPTPEYYKPQYQFVISPQMAAPMLPEVPSEGELCPVNFQLPEEYVQYEEQQNTGNNNNNNNNNFNGDAPQAIFRNPYQPAPTTEWKQMENIDYEHFENEQPKTVELKVEPIVDEKLRREKNQQYSAKCLRNKKENLKALEKQSTKVILEHKNLVAMNKNHEFNLKFAVHEVLLPVLNDNNMNYDLNKTDFTQIQHFDEDKRKIEKNTENRKLKDDDLQAKEFTMKKAENDLNIAKYNLKNKAIMAKKLNVKPSTFGSRRCRALDAYKTANFDYQISWYKLELEAQREISSLLEWNLKYIRPNVNKMLREVRGDLCQAFYENRLPVEESEAMRFFLYCDAG